MKNRFGRAIQIFDNFPLEEAFILPTLIDLKLFLQALAEGISSINFHCKYVQYSAT
jgi:hypothetical protein